MTIKCCGVGVEDTNAVFKNLSLELRDVGRRDVLIKVEYCGVCHSDLHQVRGEWPIPTLYPMVPGHEVVGCVESVGSDVIKYKVGDRVGVGCMVDSCRKCEKCKEGKEQYCAQGSVSTYNGKLNGRLTFGGYAQKLVVDEDFVLRIPDNIDSAKAGPLLCAGITMYSPLKYYADPNGGRDYHVGVHGFGGLGNMAVKLAIAMGYTVTVISRGTKKQAAAENLGAGFIDSENEEEMKKAERSFDLIISTVSGEFQWGKLLNLVKVEGKLCLVGVPPNAIKIEPFDIVATRRIFAGSMIGGIPETQEMLDFCAKHQIFPDIQLVSASQLNEVHCNLAEGQGDVFRYVIRVGETLSSDLKVSEDPRLKSQTWNVRGSVEPASANKHKAVASPAVSNNSKSTFNFLSKASFCTVLTLIAVASGYLLGKRK